MACCRAKPCELSPTEIIFREITLTGFWLNLWLSNPDRADEHQAVYSELAQMIAAGRLHAEVEATYPLSRVKEACAHALTWGRSGKIILTPQVED